MVPISSVRRGTSRGRRAGWVTSAFIAALHLQSMWGGDILRGGAAPNIRQSDPSIGASVAAQQQARASQQDALSRTAQSLAAVRAMQAQARAAATASGANSLGADPNHPGDVLPAVPDGLGPGGLQLSGAPVGASAPTQSLNGGKVDVTVRQSQQQAFLNWESFNVGRNTHLRFDQSAGGDNVSQWIAFNRVNDPTGRPSQILGQISAPGQVYIINQNGIVFGGTSQINVRSLVASSLPIDGNLIERGLLNNPDSQFLFSALAVPAGTKGPTPAFAPPASNLPDNRHGDVTVLPGAVISSPATADGNGGRIMLVGPNVTNGGSLLAPNGQVILAAGLQVGVAAHRSGDASLRGLDVFVGEVGSYGGTAINNGLIEVPKGSASLSGKAVTHNGAIESSTSVSLNGRIDLLANYGAVPNKAYDAAKPATGEPFLFKSSGAVTLGAGSVTRILPEWSSAEKAVGTELALRSQVNLQGKTILLGRDARILAPNAQVSVKAGSWYLDEVPSTPISVFVASSGQVYFEPGASINVSGSTGVTAPLSQTILSLVLRGGELAPSPLQRTGILRGPTLTVDLRNKGVYNGRAWVGTPLADLTGYVGLIERTVGELTVAGGSVDISAGSSVVMQPGSSIDVRGGHIEYLGGTVKTSRVWADGHLLDIGNATPDRVYSGIYTGTADETHARWGVTRTFTQPLALTGEHYEPTYLHGADAGSLAIAAPSMALDGSMVGSVSPGPRQLRATPHTSEMPVAGDLSLSFSGQTVLNSSVAVNFPKPPSIVFDARTQPPASPFALDAAGNPADLDEPRRRTVYLSPQLATRDGWGSITIHNAGGNITVPGGVTLRGRPGGAFRFYGANLGIFGDVIAPGGTLAFQAFNFTPYEAAVLKANPNNTLPPANPGRGEFVLGEGVTLSAAGLLVDDRLNAGAPLSLPARLKGGSVSIKAYSTDLRNGSTIDVSGGALITPQGQRHYGDGGSIVLHGGLTPELKGVMGGGFHLGSTLLGYSGAVGGSLEIQAPLIRVGSRAAAGGLSLDPGFFSDGGFSRFSLIGLPAIAPDGSTLPSLVIAGGTRLTPTAQSYVLVPNPQGGGLAKQIVEMPPGVRPPVSLSFAAPGVTNEIDNTPVARGDLIFGEGAIIRTDPLASIGFSGQTVAILGKAYAPGGTISVTAGSSNAAAQGIAEQALTTLFLGPRSLLSTRGTALYLPDAYGRRTGLVLPGGTVSLTGNILAAPGSVIDVSGASGVLDLHPVVAEPLRKYRIPGTSGITEGLYSLATVPVRVDSNAGTINLTGIDFLVSDATLKGFAGGPTALGGTLNVASGRFYPQNTVPPPTDTNLTVWQAGSTVPAGALLTADALGKPLPGNVSGGFFTANSFARGGFDSLTLGGSVKFQGPVTIDARGFLKVATDGILSADDAVRLSAPYVALGIPVRPPQRPEDRQTSFGSNFFAPTYGPGQLIVSARHIDVGTLSLLNI